MSNAGGGSKVQLRQKRNLCSFGKIFLKPRRGGIPMSLLTELLFFLIRLGYKDFTPDGVKTKTARSFTAPFTF
jgi:hypothetical protein